MPILQRIIRHLTPVQLLLVGFTLIIALGAVLLSLPAASSDNTSQPFIDALFTSASAVTTTGLVVEDTGRFYSVFGQAVILLLFQIGGLGYMAFFVMMAYILGRKPSLISGITLQESFVGLSLGDIKNYLKRVFYYTVFFEILGAIVLGIYWMRDFSLPRSLYLGLYYSVSAFCTAGFGLFPDSLSAYQGSLVVNLVINILCIAGGMGFFVLYDFQGLLGKKAGGVRPRGLTIHTRLALRTSILLMTFGAFAVFLSELLAGNVVSYNLVASSIFQSISASTTTGFNTQDIGSMSASSLSIIVILMFIGASPGGSGGGIKTTTFAIAVLFSFALLNGREDVNVFKRRIPGEIVARALVIGFIAVMLVAVDVLVLTLSENASFLEILFEIVSAFGTVGLSTGLTSDLSTLGKIVISVNMLIGRLGPLAIGFSIIGRPRAVGFRYGEGKVYVG